MDVFTLVFWIIALSWFIVSIVKDKKKLLNP